jgi:hypothetical protein
MINGYGRTKIVALADRFHKLATRTPIGEIREALMDSAAAVRVLGKALTDDPLKDSQREIMGFEFQTVEGADDAVCRMIFTNDNEEILGYLMLETSDQVYDFAQAALKTYDAIEGIK